MKKFKNIFQNENLVNILILFIAAFFICIPLLSSKIDVSYDDGIQHIARLMGTFQSLQEKQSFPVIMSNFCNSFGYSWNLFYSPFTAFLPLIFKIFNASFIGCIKMFMFVTVFASGIAMYFFTKEVTKNKKMALISGILYIFAPYRLTDMYARNALAELTSFIFIPMIFHGLYGIIKGKSKKEYFLIIGSICLILTHTVVAMYVATLCFTYLLTQAKKLKIKSIRKKLIISLLFIVAITSFFWMPLLESKNSADYEVFKPGRMERTDVLIAFKLRFFELFITPKNNIMTYEIGWLSIILLLFTPFVIRKLRKKYINTDFYSFYIYSLIAGLVCAFMTLQIFPFEYMPSLFKMIQFSFRLLEFSSFFFSFVVAVNFGILVKKIKYKDVVFVLVILMILTCTYIPHLHYTDSLNESKLWPAIPVTSETKRVHAGCASFEYLPCKAFENRSYIETRNDDIIVLTGNAQIENKKKNGTNLTANIINSENETLIEFPYIYYIGYSVKLKQSDEIIELKTLETDNGFVGVILPETQNTKLAVSYKGTTIMNVTKVISIVGIILLIIKVFLHNRKLNR